MLEILDARDPMTCRNKYIESYIQSLPGEKKIILVVNKVDLISPYFYKKGKMPKHG